MATGNDAHRSLLQSDVLEHRGDGHLAVISVGTVLSVLMPLDFRSTASPLEVQIGVHELDVRPYEIGRDIGDKRLRDVLPKRRMGLVGVRHSPQAWRCRGV